MTDIKELKGKFLRGKTVPALGNLDIHVICGCIKDFLRNLREPIIPTSLWTKFANAVQNYDDAQAVKDLLSAINELPQANRDTLAFLILHLKRYVFELICSIWNGINLLCMFQCCCQPRYKDAH